MKSLKHRMTLSDCRHRQPANAVTDRSRQGRERTTGAAVASLLSELRDYWKRPLADDLFPDVRSTSEFHHDSEDVQSRRAEGRNSKERHASHAATFVRDRSLTISRLLGHKSFRIYLHVRRPHLQSTPSPVDWLPVRQVPRYLQNDETPPHDNDCDDILKQYAGEFVRGWPSQAPPHVQSMKLSLCDTHWANTTCDHSCIVHNSCGDRHCPQCMEQSGGPGWIRRRLLPGIDYFQVVFTMPDKLSSLALIAARYSTCCFDPPGMP